MTYLLDANVFIEGKNRAYAFDLCPGFWHWLDRAHRDGTILSIEQVGDELRAGHDDLADWAAERSDGFFTPMDPEAIPALTTASSWVQEQPQYDAAAETAFFSGADLYLVAYALAHGCTVVTHETPAPAAKKVKIPTVCIGLGIKFVTPYQMLRREGVRFVLSEEATPR